MERRSPLPSISRSNIRSTGLGLAALVIASTFLGCRPVGDSGRVAAAVREVSLRPAIDPVLLEARPVVPDDQNGWPKLLQAGRLAMDGRMRGMARIADGHLSASEAKVRKQVEAEVGSYRAALALVDQALEYPAFDALQAPNPSPQYPELLGLRNLAHLRTANARVLAANYRSMDAAKELLAVIRLGQALQEAGGGLTRTLEGVEIEMEALRTVRALTRSKRLDSALGRLIDALSPSHMDEAVRDALRSEFQNVLLPKFNERVTGPIDLSQGVAFDPAEGGLSDVPFEIDVARVLEGHRQPYDARDTVIRASQVVASTMRRLEAPHRSLEPSAKAQAMELGEGWPKALIEYRGSPDIKLRKETIESTGARLQNAENPYGRLLVAIASVPLDSVVRQSIELQTSRDATRVQVGIRKFEIERARYPGNLSDLRLEPAPIDRFSGLPFRFDPERRVFWSVYANGKDDGGTDEPEGIKPWPMDLVYPGRR